MTFAVSFLSLFVVNVGLNATVYDKSSQSSFACKNTYNIASNYIFVVHDNN